MLFRKLASEKLSDFGHQLRLLDIAEGDFDGADAGLPALAVLLDRIQVERYGVGCTSIGSGNQAPLPMAIVANCLKRLYLHQAACEPFKILCPAQLAVQPGRTCFERVLRSRNKVFHVQQDAKVAAESGAIFVRYTG